MFGMGMPEIVLILAIALIVIGPKKLPDLAKSLGRALGEFKKATTDFKEAIQVEEAVSELKKPLDDLKKSTDLKSVVDEINGKTEKAVSEDGGKEPEKKADQKELNDVKEG